MKIPNGQFRSINNHHFICCIGFLTDTNGNSRDKERSERDFRERELREASRDREKSASLQRVRIIDANLVYDGLNLGRRIDVVWPDEAMRSRGGRSFWQSKLTKIQM